MAKGGCLSIFFRARWRVSSKLPSNRRGSSSNMAALLFTLTVGISLQFQFFYDSWFICIFDFFLG
jgi:hypothetical protein